jgi:two-component system CheB/CheR fusion protein
LGGTITVKSTESVGSTFIFTAHVEIVDAESLHLANPRQAVPQYVQDVKPKGKLLQGCRVLLIEDSEDISLLVKRALVASGATVVWASNGVAALEEIDAGYDAEVIISDMQMPVMDGYETVRKLRERGVACPIIAMTAGAMLGDKEKCLAVGCSDYASKPIRPHELSALVLEWWHRTKS